MPPPLIASSPNQSTLFLPTPCLPSDITTRPSYNSFASSARLSFPLSRFPTNFPHFKLDAKHNCAFHTTRCFASHQADVANENNSNQDGKIDVRALASTLQNAVTADDVEELLKDYPHLPLQVYNCVVRGLGMYKKLDAAFAVVQWLKKNKTLNVLIYNSLLCAVKITKRYERVADVIEDMKLNGFEPSIITYNTLMSIYIEQGKPNEVFNLFSQIELAGQSPSAATYCTILSAYKELEDANGVLQYFIKLREKYRMGELQRDSSEEDWEREFAKIESLTLKTCALIMGKWLEENKTTEVLRFVSCMDKVDVKLDLDFFERLFWACKRGGHYPVVRELYKRLKESGLESNLSVNVYNHIILITGKAKKWWAALEVYEEMLERGPLPNNFSFELVTSNFSLLVNNTKRRRLWRWIIGLLDKMHKRGLTPTSKQWNSVLNACSKAGEFDVAIEVFGRMIQKGVKPTVHTYGVLLNALLRGALYDELIRVWDHMQKVGVNPNVHAYTVLASMYAKKGDHSMVDSVLQDMVGAKIEPTVVTFNAIISSCVKVKMVAAAFEWFNKMQKSNVKPNAVSYEMLIEALALDGKPRLAYEMYVQAFHDGLVLNKKVYQSVFEAGKIGGSSVDLGDSGVLRQDGSVVFEAGHVNNPIQIKNNQDMFCGSPS